MCQRMKTTNKKPFDFVRRHLQVRFIIIQVRRFSFTPRRDVYVWKREDLNFSLRVRRNKVKSTSQTLSGTVGSSKFFDLLRLHFTPFSLN